MAQNNQACLLLQVKMSVCLKLELCDFVSQVQSLEQRTKVLVIRAVFPAMRYRLKLHSCPLYRRNFIKDPLVKGLMWYPKGTQFLLLKYTTKGTEPPLYHFSGECCREVGDDGQVFAFPALGTRLICGTGKMPSCCLEPAKLKFCAFVGTVGRDQMATGGVGWSRLLLWWIWQLLFSPPCCCTVVRSPWADLQIPISVSCHLCSDSLLRALPYKTLPPSQ